MSMNLKTYDAAEYLQNEEDVRLYLEAAFEDGDPAVIRNAIATAARARGMSAVAEQASISRAGLYRALGENGNPTLDTLAAILDTFGLRLSVSAKTRA